MRTDIQQSMGAGGGGGGEAFSRIAEGELISGQNGQQRQQQQQSETNEAVELLRFIAAI